MKKAVIVTLFLLIMPIAFSQDWIYSSQELEIELDISSSIILTKTSADYSIDYYSIDYVTANLSFYPKTNAQQTILSLETTPVAVEKNGLIYTWNNPDINTKEFGLSSKIKIKNIIPEVQTKVKFPVELTEELATYTLPSKNIDSNNGITSLASSLAEGEDDMFRVAFNLAEWANNNLKYDIAYGTSVKEASWVFENKKGTCDEFASLFISLARALKIPAKYVSGVAYSNLPEIQGFSNHAWAELYFPGYGWIPFDPTYREFGFVDATHIKLKESIDSDESSIEYRWKSSNVNLEAEKIDSVAKITNHIGSLPPHLSIKSSPLKESVGFGSYNLIQADIQNLNLYYIITEISISKPEEVEIIGNAHKLILLKPDEQKSVFWTVRLSKEMDLGYMYTMPVAVYSARNISASASFTSSASGSVYSKEDIEETLSHLQEEEEKTYSMEVALECISDKKELYLGESAEIKCTLKNKGNTLLESLKVCLEKSCKTINLGIAEEKETTLSFTASKAGKQELTIVAKNPEITKSAAISLEALDKPNITIKDVEYPEEVEFRQEYFISFSIDKTSYSSPQNVKVILSQGRFSEEWEIPELKEDRTIKINLLATDLKKGQNQFKITVEYEDKKGNQYATEQEFYIKLANVTFWQNMQIMFNRFGRWVEGIFK